MNNSMPEKPVLKWVGSGGRLHLPKYPGDAGFDLETVGEHTIKAYEMTRIPCGIEVEIPDGFAALIIGRSSSYQHGLIIMNTLIDSGYRGLIFLLAFNCTDMDSFVDDGMRLAQFVLIPNFGRLGDGKMQVQVRQVERLSPSPRGINGFGSSGGGIA